MEMVLYSDWDVHMHAVLALPIMPAVTLFSVVVSPLWLLLDKICRCHFMQFSELNPQRLCGNVSQVMQVLLGLKPHLAEL